MRELWCGLPRFLTGSAALDTKEHSFLLRAHSVLLILQELTQCFSLHLITKPSSSLLTPLSLASSRYPSSSSPWVSYLDHIQPPGSPATSVLLASSSLSAELSRAPNLKGRAHKARHSRADSMLQSTRCWGSKENFSAHLKCRPSLLRSISHVSSLC